VQRCRQILLHDRLLLLLLLHAANVQMPLSVMLLQLYCSKSLSFYQVCGTA
jgi:hypothetical protein